LTLLEKVTALVTCVHAGGMEKGIAAEIIIDVVAYNAKRGRDYGADWPAIRQAVIRRDGGICKACHRAGPLDVHHRVPLREFSDTDEANELTNLVALCRSCHGTADQRYRDTGEVFPQ
jgi:5-methylcytosine-specific restriction endonuclease McrA